MFDDVVKDMVLSKNPLSHPHWNVLTHWGIVENPQEHLDSLSDPPYLALQHAAIILPLPWLLFNSVYYTSVCAQLRTWPFSRALGSSQPGWGVKPFILGIARPTYKQSKYSLTLDIVNIPGYNQGQMAVSTTRYQKWSCVSWMNQEGLLGEGKFVSGLTLCRNRILVAREEITRHFKQKVQQK